MAVGRDKPPGLYLALSKLYTYLCKVDQSMALHCFSLFADAQAGSTLDGIRMYPRIHGKVSMDDLIRAIHYPRPLGVTPREAKPVGWTVTSCQCSLHGSGSEY